VSTRASPVALLLSAWLGAGVLFATVVAPAAFAVLPSRSLAGALVGRVLPVLYFAGIAVAAVGIWLDRAAVGRFPRVRRVALAVVAIACAVAQIVVAPRIERLRADIAGPIERLAPDDPRRVAFGRLHAVSVAWLGVAMLAAGATIVLASVAPRSQRPNLQELRHD
jgi:hypothetical protein